MNGSVTWVRVGGVCGVIFAVLPMVPVFGGGTHLPPDITATGNEIIAYYATGAARVGTVATILAAPFAPWFLATLTLLLWTQPAARPYAAVGLVAAGLRLLMLTIVACVRAALVYGTLDENSAHALNTAYHTVGLGDQVMLVAASLAFGVAQLRMHEAGLWRWAGCVALLAALLSAIAVLTLLATGTSGPLPALPGLLVFNVWVVLTAALQIWRGPEMAGAPVASPVSSAGSAVSA